MKKIITLLILMISFSTLAETVAEDEKVVGVFYFSPILGHVHQSPKELSSSLTTIQCGHPIKVIESTKVKVSPEWSYVQVADFKGFILKSYLVASRPECFQGRYPKFFDGLNLDLSELYYWGRLYDNYLQGQSKVQ
ncbi:MAG: hypothetical protein ACOVP4_00880 [Bacteriovoracaceae bacterium]|jgi:hypothetical protein